MLDVTAVGEIADAGVAAWGAVRPMVEATVEPLLGSATAAGRYPGPTMVAGGAGLAAGTAAAGSPGWFQTPVDDYWSVRGMKALIDGIASIGPGPGQGPGEQVGRGFGVAGAALAATPLFFLLAVGFGAENLLHSPIPGGGTTIPSP